MRGKPLFSALGGNNSRITPADAGKTIEVEAYSRIVEGSPPRMRGKLVRGSVTAIRLGITPADAGKTEPVFPSGDPAPDHPRACGENLDNIASSVAYNGSPPRMRGKQNLDTFSKIRTRITPAHAGKTAIVADVSARRQDHPRACGENCVRVAESGAGSGSPPRMRGKRLRKHRLFARKRITPAHAGKTVSTLSATSL